MENTNCLFTFIIGGYDNLKNPFKISDNWDYVCVTDTPINNHSSIWQIKQVKDIHIVKNNDKKTAMSVMMQYYEYLSDKYETIITIGGQLCIDIKLDKFLSKYGYNTSLDLMLIKHSMRYCVYQEAQAVIELKKDSEELVNKQMDRYRNDKYPSGNKLFSSGIMVINNRSVNTRKFYDTWYNEYKNAESKRDMLSLNYSMWKYEKTNPSLNIGLLHYQEMKDKKDKFGNRDINLYPHAKKNNQKSF
tara:strand:- start:104 stop:841 length:738 start_codon:yes stop_codon:yes gene_type:complete